MFSGERLIPGDGALHAVQPQAHAQPGLSAVAQSIGVDLVDIRRLQDMGQRWGELLVSRLFTEQERAACRTTGGYRWKSLAGRFGAKEATKKVFAAHGVALGWMEVEVQKGPYGEPLLTLHGTARTAAEHLGYTRLLLSISHEANMAIAIVVAV